MRKGYVYALSCPLTRDVRYIGRTVNIEERLSGHICAVNNPRNPNKELIDWIKGLLQKQLKPIISVLGEAENGLPLSNLEQLYIDKYIYTGLLLNRGRLTKQHEQIDYKALHTLARTKKIRYKVIAEHLGVDYCSIAGYLTGQRCQLGFDNAKRLQAFINSY